jgi:ABC-type nitrate/sulfonate/bicarbonate transport system substrate-binding protein
MMKHLGCLCHLVLLAILWGIGNLHGAEKIRVSGGGMTPLHSLIWVANHEGLFKKYGMDVEYLAMNSGTLGVQTMLSNDSQFLCMASVTTIF